MLEVRGRYFVVNPLPINKLLLGQGDVNRVGNSVISIKLLDGGLEQDKTLYDE